MGQMTHRNTLNRTKTEYPHTHYVRVVCLKIYMFTHCERKSDFCRFSHILSDFIMQTIGYTKDIIKSRHHTNSDKK